MGDTLGFAVLGNHCLLVHNSLPVSDADWLAHVEAFADVCARVKSDEPFGVVVLTDGPAPNPRQRGMVDGRPQIPKYAPAAIMTLSPLSRGIITALGWMGHRGIEAFKPVDYTRAFEHVKLPPERHREALRVMLEMKRKFVNDGRTVARVQTHEELLSMTIDELRSKSV